MSRRYFAKTRADYFDEARAGDYLAKTVLEQDNQPRDSGLLDARGNKLFSAKNKPPIGFVRFSEGYDG